MESNAGKKQKTLLGIMTVLLRIVCGATFIFSGFVKGVDSIGTAMKIEEYFVGFGIDILSPSSPLGAEFVSSLSITVAIVLAITEFVIGANLLFGIYRRTTAILLFLFMVVMTPITLYLAIADPIHDCGCFGEAVVISNWATFYKNLILLAFSLLLLRYNKEYVGVYARAVRWLPGFYSVIFMFIIAAVSVRHQPVLDFRPYKSGLNIREAVQQNVGTAEMVFIYEKDGERREFPLAEAPVSDTTWHFVDRIEKFPQEAENQYSDFIIRDNDDDITEGILADTAYTFLVFIPSVEGYEDSWQNKIDELYDYAYEHTYNFYALSPDAGSWQQSIEASGMNYPCYTMDETTIKTIIRGNPAVALIKDGILYWKRSPRDIPDMAEISVPLQQTRLGEVHPYNFSKRMTGISLIYFIPLLLMFIAEKGVIGIMSKIKEKREEAKKKKIQEKEKNKNRINNKTKKEMRKNIVAGNWKMNKTLQEGVQLAKDVEKALESRTPNCEVIIATPFIHLATIASTINTDKVGVSAENCADKASGAYTGEVSAAMVASTGAKYVILGHSERRAYYGETPEILKEKVLLALANGLKVIFCIGEVLEEREAGKEYDVVKSQIEGSLFNLSAEDFGKIILAYEPVWAIGTGKTATAQQAQEMHAFIRKTVADKYGAEVAENTSILYGGSCKPSNAKELFANKDVDGGLIGGASLDAEQFMGIVDAF